MSYDINKLLLEYVPQEGLILDAGCGCFHFSNNLRGNGGKVTTIDIFISDVAEAKRNNFILASVENLPFKDNSFDFIYCLSVLEFIKDDTRVISEFQRILKPGGNLVFTVPTSRSAFRWLRELEILFGVYRWPQFNGKHYRYYTRADIRKLVGNKFTQIDIRGYSYNFLPRLCGFLISVSRLKSILRFLRLHMPLAGMIGKIGKKSPGKSTMYVRPDEARNINTQKNGDSNHLWDKFELFSDVSWHYVVALRDSTKGLSG